eukprot:350868-Chlamydomonas_euryale.AAC.7
MWREGPTDLCALASERSSENNMASACAHSWARLAGRPSLLQVAQLRRCPSTHIGRCLGRRVELPPDWQRTALCAASLQGQTTGSVDRSGCGQPKASFQLPDALMSGRAATHHCGPQPHRGT